MLQATLEHLASVPSRTFEIIIIDDGSRDDTASVTLSSPSAILPQVKLTHKLEFRVVTLSQNRGKGAAVKHGFLHARGRRILMVDADGASQFKDLELLWNALDQVELDGEGLAVGSRAHLIDTEAVVKVRKIIYSPRLFAHEIVFPAFLYSKPVNARAASLFKNIRCWPYKGHAMWFQSMCKCLTTERCCILTYDLLRVQLFTRKSARSLFPPMHIAHWIFDVELLLLAGLLQIPIVEVPIAWHEVQGSKINLISDSIAMLRDLIILRTNYAIGRWEIRKLL